MNVDVRSQRYTQFILVSNSECKLFCLFVCFFNKKTPRSTKLFIKISVPQSSLITLNRVSLGCRLLFRQNQQFQDFTVESGKL